VRIMRIIILILLIPSVAISAPTISSISGTVSDGESIVITGGSNGSGATIHKWDDFEGGVNNNDIGNGWALVDADNHPIYTNTGQRTGSSLCAYTDEGTDDMVYQHGSTLSPVYITYWINFDFAASLGESYNNKHLYIGPDSVTGYPSYIVAYVNSSPGVSLTLHGTGTSTCGYIFADDNSNLVPSDETWVRMEVYAVESNAPGGTFDGTADGSVSYKIQQTGVGDTFHEQMGLDATYDGDPCPDRDPSAIITNESGETAHWEWVTFWEFNRDPGTGGSLTPGRIDDVYIASSRARVEIGDNAVFANCTHREIQNHTAWAAGEITFTVNQGSFASLDGAYLFVVDENGDASAGFELSAISCGVTGTALTDLNEDDIVTGGRTLIFTLTNTTWAATIGADNQITTDFLAIFDGDKSGAGYWDTEVSLAYTDLTRTSDTVLTLTLPATAGYDCSETETVSIADIPANATAYGSTITPSPNSFTIGVVGAAAATSKTGVYNANGKVGICDPVNGKAIIFRE